MSTHFPPQASLSKPQVTLSATFRLPLTKQITTTAPTASATLKSQLSSPLLQAASAPSPSLAASTLPLLGTTQHGLTGSQIQVQLSGAQPQTNKCVCGLCKSKDFIHSLLLSLGDTVYMYNYTLAWKRLKYTTRIIFCVNLHSSMSYIMSTAVVLLDITVFYNLSLLQSLQSSSSGLTPSQSMPLLGGGLAGEPAGRGGNSSTNNSNTTSTPVLSMPVLGKMQ